MWLRELNMGQVYSTPEVTSYQYGVSWMKNSSSRKRLTVSGSSKGSSMSACLRKTLPLQARHSILSKGGSVSRKITPAIELNGSTKVNSLKNHIRKSLSIIQYYEYSIFWKNLLPIVYNEDTAHATR